MEVTEKTLYKHVNRLMDDRKVTLHPLRAASLALDLRAEGRVYEELMRSAFTRGEIEAHLAEEFRTADALLRMVEEEDVVRVPKLVRPQVLGMLRAGREWYRKRIEAEMGRIYGAPSPPPPHSFIASK